MSGLELIERPRLRRRRRDLAAGGLRQRRLWPAADRAFGGAPGNRSAPGPPVRHLPRLAQLPRDRARRTSSGRATASAQRESDAFTRLAEGYEVLITGELRLDERESGVQYAGALRRRDARLIRRVLDPDGPFRDGSVPEPSIRAGPSTPARAAGSRAMGRGAGSAGVSRRLRQGFAPRPPLRRHRRREPVCGGRRAAPAAPPEPGAARDRRQQPGRPARAALCARPTSRSPRAGPLFEDLALGRGHLRLLGDARIWGGQIEFRDEQGGDGDRPLALRARPNAATRQAGRDLQVVLGSQVDGSNRLVVGTLRGDGVLGIRLFLGRHDRDRHGRASAHDPRRGTWRHWDSLGGAGGGFLPTATRRASSRSLGPRASAGSGMPRAAWPGCGPRRQAGGDRRRAGRSAPRRRPARSMSTAPA